MLERISNNLLPSPKLDIARIGLAKSRPIYWADRANSAAAYLLHAVASCLLGTAQMPRWCVA